MILLGIALFLYLVFVVIFAALQLFPNKLVFSWNFEKTANDKILPTLISSQHGAENLKNLGSIDSGIQNNGFLKNSKLILLQKLFNKKLQK